jgi:peptidyl-prolyl cis-trans isomerase SurA
LFLVIAAQATIIDRIAVSVGNRVITTSDIEREIRVNSFLDGTQPDLTPAGRRATAEKMVEQALIRRELETSRYPLPGPAEIEPVLADFKAKNYPDAAQYQAALAQYGITEQEVKDELLWQRTLLRFIQIRFRPGVQVSDDDIQKYFDQNVAPAARAAHPGQPVVLEDYRAGIEEKLTGDRVDQEMNNWLEGARTRNEIVFHEEVFR